MNATMTREDARQLARERLPEVLDLVVPGFKAGRAFQCLNPNHEDRNPSMRYLARSNTVRCFSCGWHGDVFDVVGAVYGLDGGERFAKAYGMLGIETRGGFIRTATARPVVPQHAPGSLADLLAVIFPPGWDAPEPAVKLPLPLTVIAEAEIGLAGILARSPVSIFVCLKCGLRGWHFDDAELGQFFEDVRTADFPEATSPEFLAWLRERAAPAHMIRKLARFVMREGQRRKVEATFSAAYTSLQNQESPYMVLEDVLNQAELALDHRFDMPALEDAAMRETVDEVFQRFHDGGDVLAIIEGFKAMRAAV